MTHLANDLFNSSHCHSRFRDRRASQARLADITPTSDKAARKSRLIPRILVIGDMMTDVIVRPDGPLARRSDRRASVTIQPGVSPANPAVWPAFFVVRRGAVRC
jgi:hypothetical protein